MEPSPNPAVHDQNMAPIMAESVSEAQLGADAWRNELSARLNRYRSKRKAPPPRYPSLKLPFDPVEPAARVPLDTPVAEALKSVPDSPTNEQREASPRAEAADSIVQPTPPAQESRARHSAKIIEFPSFAWGPPEPPPDQLAEPVTEGLRILEVPEIAPPPPALGGITIEPVPQEAPEKRLGIDVPLQSVSLARRLAASLIDGVIVAAASALFGYIFWKVAGVRPPRFQMLGLAGGIPCLFWAAYQYLLLVYSAATPGLRLAGLELTHFDGTRANRSLRRWRVLGSYLSALSLGMGYFWIFLDEDVLCWHDRITRTYLARRKPRS